MIRRKIPVITAVSFRWVWSALGISDQGFVTSFSTVKSSTFIENLDNNHIQMGNTEIFEVDVLNLDE